MQEAQSEANEDVHAGRNEVKDAVVAAELAFAQTALPVNPIRIDSILGKGRRDQNRQDPWKRAARVAPANRPQVTKRKSEV
jgi:hypothetical protein